MTRMMTTRRMRAEAFAYQGRGGMSEENGSYGFRPAFLDSETRDVYESRFEDGRPAPFHYLGGLPEVVVLARDTFGRVAGVKASLVAGFIRAGRFYTRDEAARHVSGGPRAGSMQQSDSVTRHVD